MILEAINISKSFSKAEKRTLFSSVNLKAQESQSIAISGKSGSGKTTLLHILGTLEKPDSGTLMFSGNEVTEKNIRKIRLESIGFVFQSFFLLEDFSVLDNVLMPSMIHKSKYNNDYGMHLLEQVGLQNKAKMESKLLSGGEKQRLAIARALCNDPPLILADEPTGNLDSENTDKILHLLLNLTLKNRKSLIIVTHDTTVASSCNQHFKLENFSLLTD